MSVAYSTVQIRDLETELFCYAEENEVWIDVAYYAWRCNLTTRQFLRVIDNLASSGRIRILAITNGKLHLAREV
jgi:hypothetical protein